MMALADQYLLLQAGQSGCKRIGDTVINNYTGIEVPVKESAWAQQQPHHPQATNLCVSPCMRNLFYVEESSGFLIPL